MIFSILPLSTQKISLSSDKMPMKTDFHHILREKMKDQSPPTPHSLRFSLENTDPLYLSYLLGQLPKSSFSSKDFASYQSSSVTSSTSPASAFSKPPLASPSTKSDSTIALLTPPTPPAFLNSQQKESWLWFWKRGAPLNESFTTSELQKQFRKLAQILHPDKNPHPKATETFIQLREHYQNLCAL